MNNLYQQLNQNSQLLSRNNLKTLINTFKTSNNPQQLLTNLIKTNPQAQNVLNLIQNSNKNPKQLFYELASQKGVDPQTILQLFN